MILTGLDEKQPKILIHGWPAYEHKIHKVFLSFPFGSHLVFTLLPLSLPTNSDFPKAGLRITLQEQSSVS